MWGENCLIFILQVNSIAPSDFSAKPQSPLSSSSGLHRHSVLREGPLWCCSQHGTWSLWSPSQAFSLITIGSPADAAQVPCLHRRPLSGPDHSQLCGIPLRAGKLPGLPFPTDRWPNVPPAAMRGVSPAAGSLVAGVAGGHSPFPGSQTEGGSTMAPSHPSAEAGARRSRLSILC